MSVVRFNSSGGLVVDSNIKKVQVTLNVSWNDNAFTDGLSLAGFSVSSDDGGKSWSRTLLETSGRKSRTFILSSNQGSSKTYSVSYTTYTNIGVSATLVSTSPNKKASDTKIIFYDDNGTDNNTVITLSTGTPEYYSASSPPATEPPPAGTDPVNTSVTVGPSSCPTPTPWESLLPTCGSPPVGTSSSSGLQITKTGQNQITLNLVNYANKLVTLKITHQTSATWTQSFGFSIPNCSDLSPIPGGTPYNRPSYSNGNISGTNIFYAYNIDGGDYSYVFNHSSTPGPRPTRTNYIFSQSTSCTPNDTGGQDCVTTNTCTPYTETYGGSWPHCATGVAISKNGGDRVQWQYEDGSGGNYDDQYVTVEVIALRSAVPNEGLICNSVLKNNAWIEDSSAPSLNGNCLSHYRNHSSKIRFRIPSLRSSKLTFSDPVCYSDFRGIAGAESPEVSEGTFSGEYSVLHIFNDDFNTNLSLVPSAGITVEAVNLTDDYRSTFGQNPSLDVNLSTLDRKHYVITFLDETAVQPDASNIEVVSGQDLTASGINATIQVVKKEQGDSPNKLRVWFYISYAPDQEITDDLFHVVTPEGETDELLSILTSPDITVTPVNELTDLGNQDPGYATINASNKKHYLVTFDDETVVNADASNINVIINTNKTATNYSTPMGVSKIERVTDKQVRIWFTGYIYENPSGEEIDNVFARDWLISRTRVENLTGNVFVRNWYMSKRA